MVERKMIVDRDPLTGDPTGYHRESIREAMAVRLVRSRVEAFDFIPEGGGGTWLNAARAFLALYDEPASGPETILVDNNESSKGSQRCQK